MPKRTRLTDNQVESLPRKPNRYALPDPELIGHYLRVPARTSRAPISYAVVARDPNGKQIWTTLGTANAMSIEQARGRAREAIERIKFGRPTTERGKPTVRAVAAQWLERQVKGERLPHCARDRAHHRHLYPPTYWRPSIRGRAALRCC